MTRCPSEDYESWEIQQGKTHEWFKKILISAIEEYNGGADFEEVFCIEDSKQDKNGRHTMSISFDKTKVEVEYEKHEEEQYQEFLEERELKED